MLMNNDYFGVNYCRTTWPDNVKHIQPVSQWCFRQVEFRHWIIDQFLCQKHLIVGTPLCREPLGRVNQLHVDASVSSCETHAVRYLCCTCRAKNGRSIFSNSCFWCSTHLRQPASLFLSHPLSFLVPRLCRYETLSLPEEWKYLRGLCKHSKEGTTPSMTQPWHRHLSSTGAVYLSLGIK